jgi:membrane protein implicated in regulation of membrane protease activity
MLIYIVIALFGLILLLVMLFVGEVFGGDHDLEHGEIGGADGDAGGPSVFSIRIMAAFLTAFGVGGVVARFYNLSHPASSGVGMAAGVVMAGVVYQFAKVLYSQQASSELRMTQLVGTLAEVSVAIPAGGVGQVVLSHGGERSEHIARTADGRAIARGTPVRITSLGGDAVTVAPVDTTATASGGAR